MPKLKSIIGNRYGKLVVLSRDFSRNNKRTYWKCVCDCGNTTVVESYKLQNGNVKSCGCWKSELEKISHTKHGMSHTRLNTIWQNMKKRCCDENYPEYSYYGGRGIKVCDEWKNDFGSFAKWSFNNGYNDNLTIDRIDNDKGYSPDNCRWTTRIEQGSNKRNNLVTTYNGERIIAAELARRLGIKDYQCRRMIRKGMNGNDIERRVNNGK